MNVPVIDKVIEIFCTAEDSRREFSKEPERIPRETGEERKVHKYNIEVPKHKAELPKLKVEVRKYKVELPKYKIEARKYKAELPKYKVEVRKYKAGVLNSEVVEKICFPSLYMSGVKQFCIPMRVS